MAWAPLAISAAGSLYGASQQRKAGKASAKAAGLNAAYEEAQTDQEHAEAKEQISRQRWMNRYVRGAQRATIAGTGVVGSTGSPLDAQAELAARQELQTQDAARAAELSRKAGYARARVIRAGGAAQKRAYNAQAVGSLIEGVSQGFGAYNATR